MILRCIIVFVTTVNLHRALRSAKPVTPPSTDIIIAVDNCPSLPKCNKASVFLGGIRSFYSIGRHTSIVPAEEQ